MTTPRTFILAVAWALSGCSSEPSASMDADASPNQDGQADALRDAPGLSDRTDAPTDAGRRDAKEASVPDGPHDAAPPEDATGEVDAAPVLAAPLPHKTDFLNAGCYTHTYGVMDANAKAACIQAMLVRHYTHFYLYVHNETDYGTPAFDYFSQPQEFRSVLLEVRQAGLAPVVWLFPDDAPNIRKKSTAELQGMLSSFVPQIDDLVSSYVLGLELDEYWSGDKVNMLGSHLNALTDKLIAVHQTGKKWNFAKYGWVDYMVLQYDFGESESTIKSLTIQAIADLNKPVVAGEYALHDEARGIVLGNAAVSVGASGFGNGGTP